MMPMRLIALSTVRSVSLSQKTAAQGVHTVGWMDVGFRNVFSTRPVETIEDFKGLKIPHHGK